MLAVLAAFFCLLFFAAAKKSRCRPAQGRRVKHEGITRMPAKDQTRPNQTKPDQTRPNQTKPDQPVKTTKTLTAKARPGGQKRNNHNNFRYDYFNHPRNP
jgi:hypothetical protein